MTMTKNKGGKGGAIALVLGAVGLGGLLWWFNRKPALAQFASGATLTGTISEVGTDQGGINGIRGPGMPVAGAVVTVGGLSSTPTDESGGYALYGLIDGLNYDGVVTAPGFEPEPVQVTLEAGDNLKDITISRSYTP